MTTWTTCCFKLFSVDFCAHWLVHQNDPVDLSIFQALMILEMGFLIKQDHMGRMLAQCMQRPGIDPWLHILLQKGERFGVRTGAF